MTLATRRPHVVFAGGGTAGHLFPGLAVAARMRMLAPQLRITFIGTGRTFESERVLAAGCDYLALPCRPLPRRARDTFRFVADNLIGYCAARRFLRSESVNLVIGLGGYASAPAARAAISRRIPFMLLEQNAVPGRATRWLAPRAALVCAAFAEVRQWLNPKVRLEITGNPLHAKFEALSRQALGGKRAESNAPQQLLILGGSGGARSLNQQVPLAIHKAAESLAGWAIIHQCGQRDVDATTALYSKLAIAARVTPFIDDMPAMLAATDLAISRAGGTTLAELAAAQVPAILLPYPQATDDHQLRNAEVFQAAGACRLIDERHVDGDGGFGDKVEGQLANRLAEELRVLAADRTLRRCMGTAAGCLAKLDSTRHAAELALKLMRAAERKVRRPGCHSPVCQVETASENDPVWPLLCRIPSRGGQTPLPPEPQGKNQH